MKVFQKVGLHKIPIPIQVGAGLLLLLLIATAIAIAFSSHEKRLPRHICEGTKRAVQESAQYSVIASQDKDVLMSLTHINIALGQLASLRLLIPDSEIQSITGYSVPELIHSLKSQQSDYMKTLLRIYPNIISEAHWGAAAGWR